MLHMVTLQTYCKLSYIKNKVQTFFNDYDEWNYLEEFWGYFVDWVGVNKKWKGPKSDGDHPAVKSNSETI